MEGWQRCHRAHGGRVLPQTPSRFPLPLLVALALLRRSARCSRASHHSPPSGVRPAAQASHSSPVRGHCPGQSRHSPPSRNPASPPSGAPPARSSASKNQFGRIIMEEQRHTFVNF
ncbi:hypothetical protein PVAP13_3KG046527 [Panicum virgatum]|uniref:Uncharacterized protein n=1 Tax=Panicum virgatum TaxID=38727 RepID=A0A8T0UM67_PANVG|nr:hypothetical protein PVAP13_3KG046527 [Panicum virgatum]